MISESTTSETTAQAFSYLTSVSQLCVFLAPLVGGALYNPAAQLPWITRHLPVLETFPALLPSFANGCMGIGALLSVLFFARETKPAILDKAEEKERVTYRSVPSTPGVVPVLVLFLWNWSFSSAMAANPVFYFTDIRLGGWSFTTHEISLLMGSIGLIGVVWSLFAFARLTTRFGTRKVVRCASILHMVNVSWPILSNWLLRRGLEKIFWALLPFFCLSHVIAPTTTGISMTLAINAIAPPGAIGLVNGLAFSLGAAQRSLVPAGATALFAIGVERQILGGYLVWVILLIYAVAYNVFLTVHAGKLKGKDGDHKPPYEE